MERKPLNSKQRTHLAASLRSLGQTLQDLPKTHEWHYVENGNLTGCRRLLFGAAQAIEQQQDAEAADSLHWSLENLKRYEPNCGEEIGRFLTTIQARSLIEDALNQLNPPDQLTLF
jgi:hypothetical protein